MSDSSQQLEAMILCCGYESGYYTNADVERWAERQIDASDVPSSALIDLAMLRDMCPIDVMNLLRSVGGEVAPVLAVEFQIGFVGLLHDAKRLSLENAIRALWALVHGPGVTQDQLSAIYWLDDAYDLAIARTYGTLSHVESEFRSFVGPYAESLRAQDRTFGENTA